MASGRNEKEAYDALTARQQEVLRLIAEGLSTKEIGARLKISKRTAEFHHRQLARRLAIRTIAGLTRFAIRAGVIKP